ncbi:hypothetical protein GF345_00400 [Candidatus Woesearchaeota archaeon]|nr:hypothetical protein [Candidatus Woesearchaeota archaeon]
MALLFCTAVIAQEGQEDEEPLSEFRRINKVQPTIDIFFQEDINLTDAVLYGINSAIIERNAYLFNQYITTGDIAFLESMMAIEIPIEAAVSGDRRSLSITPEEPLFNGYFTLMVQVEDIVGNTAMHTDRFYLNLTETQIIVVSPRLGVSNRSVNNLTIRTTRNGIPEDTECKIGIDDPAYNFDSLALEPFETPLRMSSTHTADDVFTRFNLGNSGTFYIVCRDESLGRVNQRRVDVYVDTIPPVITQFTFDPKKVVEYPEFGAEISADLVVHASEPVICRYSAEQELNYSDMTLFEGFDRFDFEAYSSQARNDYVIGSDETASYTFYTQCEDRAGWKTAKASSVLDVDLSAGLGISVAFPPGYTSNDTIELNALTNKRATCQIRGEDISQYTQMVDSPDQRSHRYFLGELDDGSYTYSIYCRSTSAGVIQDQTLTYTFTIDNSPPGASQVNGTLVTCYNNKFLFEPPLQLTAEDEESGISHFLLEVRQGTTALLNSTEVPADLSEVDENNEGDAFALENNTAYTFNIIAVNNVGMEGSSRSFSVEYDPQAEMCLEQNPPSVSMSENKTTGLTEVTLACTDDSGCDNNSFYYGTAGSADNCSADSLLAGPPFMVDVRESSYICYLAKDIVGNNATGSKLIEVDTAASCNNLKKDGKETDVDCGDGCAPCSAGESCLQNSDCITNYCQNSTCTEPTCDDRILNGPYNKMESDIDCGGHCAEKGIKCGLDQDCSKHDDCESGFCDPAMEVCAESTCFDGVRGPDEADVDCGGVCLDEFLQCEVGSDCLNDEDCVSGNCRAGTCKPEAQPLEPESDFPLGLILMILGLLMIAGGSGYLMYKRSQKPRTGGRPSAARPSSAEEEQRKKEEAEKARKLEEQRRKAMEEQRKKALEEEREKEEAVKKRREELEKKKEKERDKLFSAFGEAKKREGKENEGETLEEEIEGAEKSDWLSFDTFKNLFTGKKDKPKAVGKAGTGAGRPSKAPKAPEAPGSIFDELGRLEGEKEEDVYKRLDEMSKSSSGTSGSKSIREKDIYDELRQYIKPQGKGSKTKKSNTRKSTKKSKRKK